MMSREFLRELAVWNARNERSRRMYAAHPITSVYGLGKCRCDYCREWRGLQ